MASAREVAQRRFDGHFTATPSGCWEWLGRPSHYGYGRVCLSPGRILLAHRISWVLHRGPIPVGSCVLHRCDNRMCVNPEHLFLGDRGDNARDMAAKGRQFLQQHPERARRGAAHHTRLQPECVARGARNGQAKLSDAEVLLLRERRAAGTKLAVLAAAFGVHQSVVSEIARGNRWPHIGGPRTRSYSRRERNRT